VYALVPTLRVGEPVSLIYFEHVARKYRKDTGGHAAAVKDLLADEDRYFKDVAAQVWANSVVALSSLANPLAMGMKTVLRRLS
jgi:hypothetical protein